MATNFVQIESDSEVIQRLDAERTRLRKIAGLDQPHTLSPPRRTRVYRGRAQPGDHLVRRFHLEARGSDSCRVSGLRLSLREVTDSKRRSLSNRQSDIVNFQRQGWRAEEILAGLAAVLPKNVFLYVASIPNLAALGSRFVLQGGTQNNMAVVKAEVDFIRNSFRATGKQPEIIVHEHCGESGAIGAAAESLRLWRNGLQTSFVGLEAVRKIEYRTTRTENTRCNFCKNNCLRTFIDIRTEPAKADPLNFVPIQKVTKVPLMKGEQRLIIATCEKVPSKM